MDNIFQELEEHGYQIFDKNYGFEIAKDLFTEEIKELANSLIETPLNFEKHIIQSGGNKSKYTVELEKKFYDKGWKKDNLVVNRETSFKKLGITNNFETVSHEIDHIIVNKDNKCIALEIEWNTHKVFMNRDTQFWQEAWNLGAIDLSILITFSEELQSNLEKNIFKFFKENLNDLSELELNGEIRLFSKRMETEKNIEFNFPSAKQFSQIKSSVEKDGDFYKKVSNKFYRSKFGGTSSVVELNKILDKGHLGRTPFIVIGLPNVGII